MSLMCGRGPTAMRCHQVLSGLCPSGVCVQFVGPEVPDELHGTVSHVGPAGAASSGVTLAFFQVGLGRRSAVGA